MMMVRSLNYSALHAPPNPHRPSLLTSPPFRRSQEDDAGRFSHDAEGHGGDRQAGQGQGQGAQVVAGEASVTGAVEAVGAEGNAAPPARQLGRARRLRFAPL